MNNAELDALALSTDGKQGELAMQAVYGFISRFVSYPSEHAKVAHALWCVHAHMMDRWEATPRLAFLSAEPASGKTRALEITKHLVPNPVHSVNVSPAYLFRKVGSGDGATILFDEIDTVFGPKAKENEEIRGLINAGHDRGGVAGRCVVKGKAIETEEIPAYAAVAVAGLGWLPDTILTRSVIVRMRRRHSGERIEQFRRRIHGPQGEVVKTKIECWVASLPAEAPWPELPAGIEGRDADVWEPLVSIADLAGGEWPAKARAACVALVAASKDRDQSLGIKLLSDIFTAFGDADTISSRDLVRRLIELEESPWGDLKGKPLDERGLSRRLREYEIKSRNVRIGLETPKGYRREDFHEVWLRYAPPSSDKPATSATSATTQETLKLCDHCQSKGDAVSPLKTVSIEGQPFSLHDNCMDRFVPAADKPDDLAIPAFLRRNSEKERAA